MKIRNAISAARNNRNQAITELVSKLVLKNQMLAAEILNITTSTNNSRYSTVLERFAQIRNQFEGDIDMIAAFDKVDTSQEWVQDSIEITKDFIKNQRKSQVSVLETQLAHARKKAGLVIVNEATWMDANKSSDWVNVHESPALTGTLDKPNKVARIFAIPAVDSIWVKPSDDNIVSTHLVVQSAQKYEIFLDILSEYDITNADIEASEEVLENSQMRAFPYKIFHLTTSHGIRTVCISDQVGEKTYVYEGKVDADALISTKKGDPIGNIPVVWVSYRQNYRENLARVLFSEKFVVLWGDTEDEIWDDIQDHDWDETIDESTIEQNIESNASGSKMKGYPITNFIDIRIPPEWEEESNFLSLFRIHTEKGTRFANVRLKKGLDNARLTDAIRPEFITSTFEDYLRASMEQGHDGIVFNIVREFSISSEFLQSEDFFKSLEKGFVHLSEYRSLKQAIELVDNFNKDSKLLFRKNILQFVANKIVRSLSEEAAKKIKVDFCRWNEELLSVLNEAISHTSWALSSVDRFWENLESSTDSVDRTINMVSRLGIGHFIKNSVDRDRLDKKCIALLSEWKNFNVVKLIWVCDISEERWIVIRNQGLKDAYDNGRIIRQSEFRWKRLFENESEYSELIDECIVKGAHWLDWYIDILRYQKISNQTLGEKIIRDFWNKTYEGLMSLTYQYNYILVRISHDKSLLVLLQTIFQKKAHILFASASKNIDFVLLLDKEDPFLKNISVRSIVLSYIAEKLRMEQFIQKDFIERLDILEECKESSICMDAAIQWTIMCLKIWKLHRAAIIKEYFDIDTSRVLDSPELKSICVGLLQTHIATWNIGNLIKI